MKKIIAVGIMALGLVGCSSHPEKPPVVTNSTVTPAPVTPTVINPPEINPAPKTVPALPGAPTPQVVPNGYKQGGSFLPFYMEVLSGTVQPDGSCPPATNLKELLIPCDE